GGKTIRQLHGRNDTTLNFSERSTSSTEARPNATGYERPKRENENANSHTRGLFPPSSQLCLLLHWSSDGSHPESAHEPKPIFNWQSELWMKCFPLQAMISRALRPMCLRSRSSGKISLKKLKTSIRSSPNRNLIAKSSGLRWRLLTSDWVTFIGCFRNPTKPL